jgi:hypothetical protein
MARAGSTTSAKEKSKRKSRSGPSPGQKRKTGPLCSSYLHKGPISYLAAIPDGCKGHFRSFGEVSLCVRLATRRRQSLSRGYDYFFFFEVFFATFLVAAFAVFFAFFAFLAMSSSAKTGSVNMGTPCIDMHNIETLSQMQN